MSNEQPNPETKEGGMTLEAWKAQLLAYAIAESEKDMRRYFESADMSEYYKEGATPVEAWDEKRSCW